MANRTDGCPHGAHVPNYGANIDLRQVAWLSVLSLLSARDAAERVRSTGHVPGSGGDTSHMTKQGPALQEFSGWRTDAAGGMGRMRSTWEHRCVLGERRPLSQRGLSSPWCRRRASGVTHASQRRRCVVHR